MGPLTAYPILATPPDGDLVIDALFVSQKLGLIVFDFPSTDPADATFRASAGKAKFVVFCD